MSTKSRKTLSDDARRRREFVHGAEQVEPSRIPMNVESRTHDFGPIERNVESHTHDFGPIERNVESHTHDFGPIERNVESHTHDFGPIERVTDHGQKTPAPKPEPEPEPRRVNQSYRLPEPLVLELQRVGLQRKQARLRPWSSQDIVAEALQEWLEKRKNKSTGR